MSEPSMEHLPYYREYIEQILRPRVVRLVDDVRANLATHVWNELLKKLAEDQNPGGSMDPALIQKMRSLLEQTLGLRIGVMMDAEFAGGPSANGSQQSSSSGPDVARRDDQRASADVVSSGNFPDNPLARAVGGIRRMGR